MPSTCVFSPSKVWRSLLYPGIWTAQTDVNASGWKMSTTFFFPRKDESVTLLFALVGACVKSGALSPTLSVAVLSHRGFHLLSSSAVS